MSSFIEQLKKHDIERKAKDVAMEVPGPRAYTTNMMRLSARINHRYPAQTIIAACDALDRGLRIPEFDLRVLHLAAVYGGGSCSDVSYEEFAAALSIRYPQLVEDDVTVEDEAA